MTIPLLMLILGGSIYLDLQQQGEVEFAEVAKFVALEKVVLPALALAALTRWTATHRMAARPGSGVDSL